MDVLIILEVAIGIILVYLILSLVCTSLVEALIGTTGLKSKTLQKAIVRLLGDEKLAKSIYADPEIVALHGPKEQLPSYIPTDVFARCILNVATNNEWRKSGSLPTVMREKFVALSSGGGAQQKLGKMLVDFIDEANGDIHLLHNKIELWFDRTNDRSTGWFKRKVNWWLVGLGFAVALAVNADTIQIFQRLSDDPALRVAAVQLASERVSNNPDAVAADGEDGAVLEAVRKQVGEVLPFIGWSNNDPLVVAWYGGEKALILQHAAIKSLGLLLTAFAISLGAPFWFELLQKLVNVRKSVAAGKATDISKSGKDETAGQSGEGGTAVPGDDLKEVATGPMAGFVPSAANVNLGNAYWLAKAANLAYETDSTKLMATLASWGLRGYVLESKDPEVQKFWKASVATVDTQGFIAVDDNAILVCFRGAEAARPADIVTTLKVSLVSAGDYGTGQVHEGFKSAIDSVWEEVAAKISKLGANRQPVWFAGHSLGGALAVLAASRYDLLIRKRNAEAKKAAMKVEQQMEPDQHDNATLIGKRQQALAGLRGRVAGIVTIGQPRIGDEAFADEINDRMGQSHVRVINNRDIVPRVPFRAMDYRHSGTLLYIDEFGRLHRDPGLWYRLLDTVVISKAEVEKAKEGGLDHNSAAYVDLLDKARQGTSALARLALA